MLRLTGDGIFKSLKEGKSLLLHVASWDTRLALYANARQMYG